MAAKRSPEELAIEVRDVYKQYGRGNSAIKVLTGINMEVPYHTIFALLGASGCGKTTLLRCCLGFILPNKGRIAVMGNPPRARGTKIPGKDLGYMPQDIGLVKELSIMETMYFFGIMFRMSFKRIRERAQFLGKLLELPSLNKHIGNMSGGEQRRVSFAVSLIQEPPLLILDEPTVGMDTMLRQSVWQYIGELTAAKECTIIITTHYIDEARRADTVGLMRGGKLMTQSKPEDLIRAHNALTLEEVFVKLAYEQEQGGDESGPIIDQKVDASIQEREDITAEYQLKPLSFIDEYFPRSLWDINLAIILAITVKTITKDLRSILSIFMVLFIPLIGIIGTVYFVGGDIQNVKVFYHNDEHDSVFVQNFISDVANADEFDLEQVSQSEVESKIKDGKGPLGFIIDRNFTESLRTRYQQVCQANFNSNVEYPPESVIRSSSIGLYVDATDSQLLTQSMFQLNAEGETFRNSFFNSTFDAEYDDLFKFPVQLVDVVFGSLSWEYRDYVGTATLTVATFYNAVPLIAMGFVLERKAGLFERSYAAGASVSDFVIAYTLHGSVILAIEVTMLLVVTFGIFGIERTGSIFLYTLIIWLTGMIGFAVGLLLSSQINEEIAVQNAAWTFAGMIAYVSGNLWPVNGQPTILRTIGSVLPDTKPTAAATAIGSKGLGLGDEPVYLGFIYAVGWLLVFYIASIAFFRTE